MKDTRTKPRARIGIGAALLALAPASGCVPKAAPRQTDVMVKTASVEKSATEVRAQVNDLADRLAGRLEDAADRIRDGTADRDVRLRALALKADAIPAVYTAAYRVDPLVGALDVWALAFQFGRYVEDGAGRDAFGSQQPLARNCARELLADTDAVLRTIAMGPEAFDRARQRVEGWSTAHPVERTFAARASIATAMAEDRTERDAFVSVGAVTDTLENISDRLNTYAAQLPKQARWQAEIAAAEMAETHQVKGALDDVKALGTAARRADGVLADVSELLESGGPGLREIVAAERRAVLEEVNGQRLQTLEYASAERRAMLAALREERIESLKEVDAIKTRAVESAVKGLRELVDYTLWRMGVLFLILMVSAAALGIVGYRLTVGRPDAATS